ncbi:MAG: TOBE domain-containing protein [Desulfatirhabdiaceae bacterium]
MYTLGVRPESIRKIAYEKADLKGKVVHLERRGADNILTIEISTVTLNMTETAGHPPREGSIVGIAIDPQSEIISAGRTHLKSGCETQD